MKVTSQMILGVTIWFFLSVIVFASISFLALGVDVTKWHFLLRSLFVVLEVIGLPALAHTITGEISRAVATESIAQEDRDFFQLGAEAMKKAVIDARYDCETSFGRGKVQQLQVRPLIK